MIIQARRGHRISLELELLYIPTHTYFFTHPSICRGTGLPYLATVNDAVNVDNYIVTLLPLDRH